MAKRRKRSGSLPDDEPRLATPLRDLPIRYLENQIDKIEFMKLPPSARIALLGALTIHRPADVDYENGLLVRRVRPRYAAVVKSAVEASRLF